mgnify:CR=1 FL=1
MSQPSPNSLKAMAAVLFIMGVLIVFSLQDSHTEEESCGICAK